MSETNTLANCQVRSGNILLVRYESKPKNLTTMDVNLNGNIDINITLLTIKVSSKAHTKFLSALEKHRSIMTGDEWQKFGLRTCVQMHFVEQLDSSRVF